MDGANELYHKIEHFTTDKENNRGKYKKFLAPFSNIEFREEFKFRRNKISPFSEAILRLHEYLHED